MIKIRKAAVIGKCGLISTYRLIGTSRLIRGTSLVVQMAKNLPAVWETWV